MSIWTKEAVAIHAYAAMIRKSRDINVTKGVLMGLADLFPNHVVTLGERKFDFLPGYLPEKEMTFEELSGWVYGRQISLMTSEILAIADAIDEYANRMCTPTY